MQAHGRTRRYRGIAEFGGDIAYVARHLRAASSLTLGRGLTPTFRERLMLVVTSVNQCRYCAAFHTGVARTAGISHDEIKAVLAGVVDDCPEHEALALAYARNWAENDGRSDPVIRQQVVDYYGPATAHYIDVTLRMIRIGNLTWNTIDAVAHRVSGGKIEETMRRSANRSISEDQEDLQEDLQAFDDRANEPSISYKQLRKELKRYHKI